MHRSPLALLAIAFVAAVSAAPQITLDDVRRALAAPGQPASAAIVDLRGYSFHWEVVIGEGLTAIVVSRNLGGELLAFRDGSLLDRMETGEVLGLQLFDLDEDGISELVTEQVEARGTGILVKEYRLHRIDGDHLEDLWHGVAYSHKMLPEPDEAGSPAFEVVRGYVRFESSGGGIPGPRLLHLVEARSVSQAVRRERKAYLLREGSFEEIPWPD